MVNFNRVILAGNLTADPELRYSQDGTPVCSFNIAVNRVYTMPSGEKKEEVTFVPITIWRNQAEACAEYLRKGRPVLVEGRLQMDNWTDKTGQKRSRLKVAAQRVQFLGAPAEPRVAPEKEAESLPEDEGSEENIPF